MPCSQNWQKYQQATWVYIKSTPKRLHHSPYHARKQVCLNVQNQAGAIRANCKMCRCSHGRKTFGVSWITFNTSILTPSHRHRHILARKQHTRNHQRWSHVIFADESSFSLNHSDHRARVYRRVGERFADCCIQETDGIRGISLMIWGAFHSAGTFEWLLVDSMVKQQCYVSNWRQNLRL